jgi:hypothetical protein
MDELSGVTAGTISARQSGQAGRLRLNCLFSSFDDQLTTSAGFKIFDNRASIDLTRR